MSEPLLTYRGTVYPWHCDHMGHMNVMWYVGKFDEASWQLFAAIGLTAARLRQDGMGMAGLEQRIEYKRELFPGDVLTIHSHMQEVREKVIIFVHEMTRIHEANGQERHELSARTTLTAVCVDAATRKGRALPEDVRERASKLCLGKVR